MNTQATSTAKLPPKWAFRLLSRTHILLNRMTFGRFFNTLQGDEVCFVTMTGAKSGRKITIPLMWVPHNGGVLLVASKGGAAQNPVWYSNIVKNAQIEVTHRGKSTQLRARLAKPAEKPALWAVCDSYYALYAEYRKLTDRDIPIFVCEPNG